jgi:hypothetical protein
VSTTRRDHSNANSPACYRLPRPISFSTWGDLVNSGFALVRIGNSTDDYELYLPEGWTVHVVNRVLTVIRDPQRRNRFECHTVDDAYTVALTRYAVQSNALTIAQLYASNPYYVFDREAGQVVFRGSEFDCRHWLDDISPDWDTARACWSSPKPPKRWQFWHRLR